VSRTRKFAYGVGFGYINQIVLMASGLLLTPFLLQRLGTGKYGLWVVAAQLLLYLGLIDLGIVAIIPRSVASIAGRTDPAGRDAAIAQLITATLRIVAAQTLFAACTAVVVLRFLPAQWEPIRTPLTALLVFYVLLFPFRLAQGILAGLQDTRFMGTVQLVAWGAGTLATVLLVFKGYGIASLAAGWILTQSCIALCSILRLKLRFPGTFPRRLSAIDPGAARKLLGQGGWVSVSQVAQMLLGGTDILLIGKILGPEAVVTYALTGKLIAVLANQPQMLMQVAVPGLSEMRAAGSSVAIVRVASALIQGMLLITGLVICVVMATNRAFVEAWVGKQHFGGFALTMLLLVNLLLRHITVGAIYTIFAFGRERRIAIVSLLDGLVAMAVAALLLPVIGIAGAAVGLIAGVTLVSLPANYSALLSITGSTIRDFIRPLSPWALRFVPVVLLCAVIQQLLGPQNLVGAALIGLVVAVLYLVAMRVVLLQPPLSQYIPERILRVSALSVGGRRQGATPRQPPV